MSADGPRPWFVASGGGALPRCVTRLFFFRPDVPPQTLIQLMWDQLLASSSSSGGRKLIHKSCVQMRTSVGGMPQRGRKRAMMRPQSRV